MENFIAVEVRSSEVRMVVVVVLLERLERLRIVRPLYTPFLSNMSPSVRVAMCYSMANALMSAANHVASCVRRFMSVGA